MAEVADDNKFSVFGLSVLAAGAEGKGSDRIELCEQATGVGGRLSRLGLRVLLTDAFGELSRNSRRPLWLLDGTSGELIAGEWSCIRSRALVADANEELRCTSRRSCALATAVNGVLSCLEHQCLELQIMFKQLTPCVFALDEGPGEGFWPEGSADRVLMTQALDGCVETSSSGAAWYFGAAGIGTSATESSD